jgi:hypothetical protein
MSAPVNAGGYFTAVNFIPAFRTSNPLFIGEYFGVRAAFRTLDYLDPEVPHILTRTFHISPHTQPDIFIITSARDYCYDLTDIDFSWLFEIN